MTQQINMTTANNATEFPMKITGEPMLDEFMESIGNMDAETRKRFLEELHRITEQNPIKDGEESVMDALLGYRLSTRYEHINLADFFDMNMKMENCMPVLKIYANGNEWTLPLGTDLDIIVCNQFLTSLDLGIDIQFEDYLQYSILVEKCNEVLRDKYSDGEGTP